MSIRSDFGFAFKSHLLEVMQSKEIYNFLFDFADETHCHVEGTLFVFRSSKNWADSYPEYDLLQLKDDDYLIIQACDEYPSSLKGDRGDWHDNPWGLGRYVSVSLGV